MTSPTAAGPHHSRQRCSPVRLRLCCSSEAAFPFSGVSGFCSVAPVAAHPLGEVPVVILVIIHNKSGQEPERHGRLVVLGDHRAAGRPGATGESLI